MSKTFAKALAFGAIVLTIAIGATTGIFMPEAAPALVFAALAAVAFAAITYAAGAAVALAAFAAVVAGLAGAFAVALATVVIDTCDARKSK